MHLSYVIDGISDIQATEVRLTGQTKCAVYVEDMESEPEPKKKKSFWEKALDITQVVFDVAGLIPGIGEAADLLNAGIYAARGDYANAALSAAAAIPFVGWGATAAKVVGKGISKVNAGKKLVQATTRAVDAVQALRKTADMASGFASGGLGKVFTNARKMANNLGLGEQVMKLKNVMQSLAMKSPKMASVLSTSGHVATQYGKSLVMEQAMQEGMRYEFVGDLVEKLGGDKMRAALTWVSIVSGSKRSGGSNKSGIVDGGGSSSSGGSGKKDKSKKDSDKTKKDTDKTKKEDTSKKDKDTPTSKKEETNKPDKTKSPEPSKKDKESTTSKKDGDKKESEGKPSKPIKPRKKPEKRLPRTGGKWEGEPGDGKWYSDHPDVNKITKGEPVVFKDGRPDFSPWNEFDIEFKPGELNGTKKDFDLVYEKLVEMGLAKNKTQAEKLLKDELELTPHHLSDTIIQMIPKNYMGIFLIKDQRLI